MDYKIEIVSIDKIKLNPTNTRQHTDLDIKNLIKSIQRFGFRNPIICNKDGIILCGNGRYEACKQMGITEIPVHYTDMSEEDAKAFAIMDNRSAELSTWNLEYLIPQLDSLKLEELLDFTGFNEFDLKNLGKELNILKNSQLEAQEDDFEIPKKPENKYNVEKGDIYLLGKHKIGCIDSCNIEEVKNLLEDIKVDLVWTDPPYGIAYQSRSDTQYGEIKNDNYDCDKLKEFFKNSFKTTSSIMKEGACIYVWHTDAKEDIKPIFEKEFLEYFKMSATIIWVKNNASMGWQDYRRKHEPCLYGWKGESHKFYGDRSHSTVWEVKRDNVNDYKHPTQKPIKLAEIPILNNTLENEIVYDGFLGSGTCLITCEQLNRICCGCELDERYVSAIIERFHKLKPETEIYRIRNGVKELLVI